MVIFEKFENRPGLKTALGLAVRYKYVLLLGLVGVLMLSWPSGVEAEKADPTTSAAAGVAEPNTELTEERIARALSKIEGAGAVEVVLTLRSSAEMQLAQDVEAERGGAENSTEQRRAETVIVSDSYGGESPVAVKYMCPEYMGALVVCEGADKAGVRLAVSEAVSALTGLGTDRITIAKMKNEG